MRQSLPTGAASGLRATPPAWAARAWTCEASGARCFARLERASRREHVDALLADGGPTRHAMLEAARTQLTQCLAVDAIGPLLAQVRGFAVPSLVAVAVPGLMQIGVGRVGAVLGRGAHLVVEIGDATLGLDLDQISECRVVRPSSGAATVELYDESERCAALFSLADGAGFADRARWDHVLEMACL